MFVRLTRVGNVFTGYYSANGSTWTKMSSVTLALPATIDLGLGVDNLFRSDRTKVKLHFSVINLTNREALYNFLSTFSGTHFVTPRAYQLQLGVSF